MPAKELGSEDQQLVEQLKEDYRNRLAAEEAFQGNAEGHTTLPWLRLGARFRHPALKRLQPNFQDLVDKDPELDRPLGPPPDKRQFTDEQLEKGKQVTEYYSRPDLQPASPAEPVFKDLFGGAVIVDEVNHEEA